MWAGLLKREKVPEDLEKVPCNVDLFACLKGLEETSRQGVAEETGLQDVKGTEAAESIYACALRRTSDVPAMDTMMTLD